MAYVARKEPRDGIGCIPVPLCVQVIRDLLEVLIVPTRLFLVSPGNIPQNCLV